MQNRPWRTCIALCALLLAAGAAPVSAAVSFNDVLTDPSGDVVNLTQHPAPGHTEVDIISVTSAEQGSDINVTLSLAAAYNTSASYTVSILADGMDVYGFSYMTFVGFSATGPTGAPLAGAHGSASADGKRLHWTFPRSSVTATASWRIESASTFHMDMADLQHIDTFMDTATASGGPGPGPTPEPEEGPTHMEALYEFLSITHVRMTVTMWIEGNNSLIIRMGMDTDGDGNVTAAEKDKAVSDAMKYMTNETNMTLDGTKGTETDTLDYVGAVGRTDSKATIKMTLVKDITYPEPATATTHVYRTPQENASGSGDGFGNVTDNSSFVFKAPTGWRFVRSDWPASLAPYFNAASTRVEVQGKDFKAAFEDDMPANVTLERTGGGGGGGKDKGFLPGAGALAALAALAAPAALLARRRARA